MGQETPVGPLKRISAFYDHLDLPTEQRTYLVLDTGNYITYAFRPDSRAIDWLVGRITGTDWKSRLGTMALETGSVVPSLLSFVPMIRSETVTVAAEDPFDVAVIGDRITLLELNGGRVSTIAIDDPVKLRSEIERRKRLPDSINTVPIVEADPDYPYVVEEYLDGRELVDPITEWESLLVALEQLTALYETDRQRIETATAVASLEDRLTAEQGSDRTVRSALDLLAHLDLPPALYRGSVHGDLHAGNVFVNDGVYLLDWEDVREDYLVDDLFRPFVIHHYDTPLHRVFVEMMENRGVGGRIVTDYARTIGPIAYGESKPYSGLPLFYLLSLLADVTPHGSLRTPCRELLSGVVSAYRRVSSRSGTTR
ncbi:phosphotransferase [Halalkalicoccus sp. NIPERK01]|uniref:phosphotransferase n=1 Tax=Halalkalicoccus sp. NIPERK01 TaxID=3053469 RepID=UPI00256EFECA|nr:phosphotransferase [Halalkalicoccus sp. NIPERK01]